MVMVPESGLAPKREFRSLSAAVTEGLGTGGDTYEVAYTSTVGTWPGYVGVWWTEARMVMLLVHEFAYGTCGDPILVYRDNRLWGRYLVLVGEYEKKRAAEAEKSAKGRF